MIDVLNWIDTHQFTSLCIVLAILWIVEAWRK